jgi:hypothetical protein
MPRKPARTQVACWLLSASLEVLMQIQAFFPITAAAALDVDPAFVSSRDLELARRGFGHGYHLRGSMLAWNAAPLPVER